MAKWYDQYLTQDERKHLQVGQKGIRARQRKAQIENQTSLGNPKGLRDLEKPVKKQKQTDAINELRKAFNTRKR